MSIAVKCPGCGSSYDLHDSLAGKKVHCKKCEETFLVKAKTPAKAVEDDEEEEEQAEERVSAKPRRPAVRRGDDEDDEDDDRPRKRRRYDDDDDDYPRRRPKRKKSGVPVALIAAGIGGGVFLLLVVAVGAWWLLSKKPDAAQAGVNPPPIMGAGPVAQQPNVNPGGGVAQQPNANPGGAQQPGGNAQTAMVLSNGRVGRGIGAQKSFSVDFKFQTGGPAIGMHYFLVIKSARGQGEAHFTSFELRNQGTLNVSEIGFRALNDTGPYEIYMEMSAVPIQGPFGGAGRQRISNSLTVN